MSSYLDVLEMSVCWLNHDANKYVKSPTPNTRFPSVHFSDQPTLDIDVLPTYVFMIKYVIMSGRLSDVNMLIE